VRRPSAASYRWLLAGLALVVAASICLYRVEIKTQGTTWWANHQLQKAEAFMQTTGGEKQALRVLLDTRLRVPQNPAVNRALARACCRLGLPHYGRYFYATLDRLGALTSEDRLELATVLAWLSDQSGARLLMHELERRDGGSPALWRTHAQLAASRGDDVALRAALAKVVAMDPTDTAAAIHHAESRASAGEFAQRRDGIAALLDLLASALQQRDLDTRDHCFSALAAIDIPDATQRARFAGLLASTRWQDLVRRVTQRFLLLSQPPTAVERDLLRAWMHELLAQEQNATAEERIQVTRILQRHDEHHLALECIPHQLAMQSVGLASARLDSLIALQRWREASDLLHDPHRTMPHDFQALMEAYLTLLSNGESIESTRLLSHALIEARKSGRQGSFIAIGHLAGQHHLLRLAYAAYAAAFSPQFPLATHLLPQLMQAARLGGISASAILPLLEQRIALEPWHRDLRRQTAYLRLLCGDNIENVIHETNQSLRDDPTDVYAAFLNAFAHFRLSEIEQATGALSLILQPHAWQPHEKAAMAAILAAAKETDLAQGMVRSIDPSVPFFPEESKMCKLAY